MRSYQFWWDENNIEHIAAHGVEYFEVEEVFEDQPFIIRGRQVKYMAFGQTDSGRYLTVVYVFKSAQRIRVISARDMTQPERRRFERRGK